MATHAISSFFSSSVGLRAGFERDERGDALAFHLVRHADHRRLGDRFMGDQRAFDLHRAQAMAGDIDHIVDAAHDPEVAVLVAPGAVAGEIAAGDIASSIASRSDRDR